MKKSKVENCLDLLKLLDNYKSSRSWIFRGQANSEWKLQPKAGRSEFANFFGPGLSEIGLFESWKRYASHYLNKEPRNDWDWLALAQHHGLATRLLDWSKNPLNAAYFAVSDASTKDGVIYCYSVKSGSNPDLSSNPFNEKDFRVFFPTGFTPRILSQRGLFTISGDPEIDLEKLLKYELVKIYIPASAKLEILRSLDFYGVNQLSIFQDLDNLSSYLNQYLVDLQPGNSIILDNVDRDIPMG